MSYVLLPLNAGDGTGGKIVADQFPQGADTASVVFSGLTFGVLGGNSYQTVDGTHGFPVDVVAGSVTIGAGTAVIGHVVVDSVAALPLPAGAATAAEQTTGNTSLASIVSALQGTIAVGGTFWQATQPVSLASLPALAAGSALIGQVEISDGTNVLGTVSHPLEVTVSNSGFAVVGQVTVVDSVALDVSVTNASVAVTGTFWQATQPVSGTVTADQGGAWNIGTVTTVTTVSAVTAITDALPAGANNLGFTTPAPAGVATGATPFKLTACAASTNATSVKNAATTLWELIALNVGTAPAYLKLYDKASAPTVGTDTPVYVLPLPSQGTANGAGAARTWPTGLKFSLGLAYAITGAMADSDTTAVAANQVLLSGSYG